MHRAGPWPRMSPWGGNASTSPRCEDRHQPEFIRAALGSPFSGEWRRQTLNFIFEVKKLPFTKVASQVPLLRVHQSSNWTHPAIDSGDDVIKARIGPILVDSGDDVIKARIGPAVDSGDDVIKARIGPILVDSGDDVIKTRIGPILP
ncbi:hypothetical protein P7K49_018715, partial [Saguinus oedipus]